MPSAAPLGLLVFSAVRHAASYLPVFDAHPDIHIRAIVEEPDAPAWAHNDARILAERYHVPVLPDPAEALARDDIGLVLVCSEPTRHARLATQALRAGKHVLVDKPMAVTLDECAMVAAAQSSKTKFTVVHRLFGAPIQRARQAIAAGHLGLIRAADCEFLSSGVFFGASVERPEFVADPTLSGGGELMNFMVYPVDYLHYLTGARVTEVFAEAGTFFFDAHKQFGVEDVGILSLRLEHDIIGSLTVGRVPFAPTPGTGASTLRLIGSHGHMTVDENRPQLDIWSTVTERRGRTIGGESAPNMVATQIRAFIRDIREDRTPLYGVYDAWATVAAIEAAYRSLAAGQPMAVTAVPAR
ncbi:MAG: Gfo/Idh/MocA family oxidoreductase [Chloroflexota bacterium]|nr:Gfo/Idh/MocA family oxidoreductase [Chloroflexota bacterium]MDQ6905906.1 Gfo/Idh/MocA family oxidoreductase [Chloroflexota bacterium]